MQETIFINPRTKNSIASVLQNEPTKTLIVLLGPTGVGKTELSIRLAERLGSPILSADSRQLYQGMSIGTAAPTPEQLKAVKHYFVHTLSPTAYYNAARFEKEVLQLLDEQFRQIDTAVMCGGSMMYIDAVCKGIDDLPDINEELRSRLKAQVASEGLDSIRQQLKLLDPVFYEQVDLRNTQRVVHALEICLLTGKPYSSLRTRKKAIRPFRILKIGLIRHREQLYQRINARVEQMISDGLEDECKRLAPLKHLNALKTVGYKEMFNYLDGEWSKDFAVEKIKQNSRIYARKQLTWFRRDPEIRWFNLSEQSPEKVLSEVLQLAEQK